MNGLSWFRVLSFCVGIALMVQIACDPATPPPEEQGQEAPTTEPTQDQSTPKEDPQTTNDAGQESVLPDTSAQDKASESTPPETPSEPSPRDDAPMEPYKITLFEKETIHSTGTVNFQNILKTFQFRNQTFAKLTLHVELSSPCYPFETAAKPPAGHNWPEACDAFDRNMDVTWNPPADKTGPPGFDLVRIITPFGGPLKTSEDITDLANAISKEKPAGTDHVIKIHITTWSDAAGKVSGAKGTWIVSAWLDVVPGTPPRKVVAAYSLFNHSYTHNDATIEKAEFTTPEGTKRAVLQYRTTGHGGGAVDSACIGPADEFCKRSHRLFADGQENSNLLSPPIIPWRTDCTKYCTETPHPANPSFLYCKENPCGDKRSVRAPRANWCPGSITPPFILEVPAFAQVGKHTFGYNVTNVGKGGSWRTSATLYLYGE